MGARLMREFADGPYLYRVCVEHTLRGFDARTRAYIGPYSHPTGAATGRGAWLAQEWTWRHLVITGHWIERIDITGQGDGKWYRQQTDAWLPEGEE